ncbi:MAG TPA: helicase C-terminal domain-containing protein [Candidatus Saccharimonadales bacterium]|nr:helicase C-terminal domain-containing protein [Candidatus Saccharimonadales bacterium]
MSDYSDALSQENLMTCFPRQYRRPNNSQLSAFAAIAEHGSETLEAPTGTGKTAVGWSYLEALERAGATSLVAIAPNKTHVNQWKELHPDMTVAYGRSEYDCLYYDEEDEPFKADEIPCLTLTNCPHRVDVETGQTVEEGAMPCPYYQAKFEARRSRKLVCTMSFYLFNNVFRGDFEPPDGLVIDEADQIAKVVRGALSYEITDFQLRRSVMLLESIGADDEAKSVKQFLRNMVAILKRKPQGQPTLLTDGEIVRLLDAIGQIDAEAVRKRIARAIKTGEIDPYEDREVLTRLERLTQNLGRYLRSLGYALPTGEYHALNLVTYAYSDNEVTDENRVNYKLIIKSYHVAGLVRKLLSPNTLAMSATIGDNTVFGYETGIQLPFVSLPGTFPAENALVLLPTDTPNLAQKERSRNQPTRVLRHIARACGDFAKKDIRSLVIVVSNRERDKFLWLCQEAEEDVDVVSYGDGLTPRQALAAFREGQGTVLLGTVANYGSGVDLPEEIAPVTFVLRPGYPNPNDPFAQFERRRFGNGSYWKVWNWRVMIEALQVRGRNIRSASDRGATIFISQQFRRFLFASLPEWLKDSYDGSLTFEEACGRVLELMEAQS